MSLLDDMRLVVRVAGSDMDGEIKMLVDAARADMLRVGVRPALLVPEAMDPLAKQAVACYVKAHFGFDNDEAERLDDSYRRCVCDLLNSTANVEADCHGHDRPCHRDMPDFLL